MPVPDAAPVAISPGRPDVPAAVRRCVGAVLAALLWVAPGAGVEGHWFPSQWAFAAAIGGPPAGLTAVPCRDAVRAEGSGSGCFAGQEPTEAPCTETSDGAPSQLVPAVLASNPGLSWPGFGRGPVPACALAALGASRGNLARCANESAWPGASPGAFRKRLWVLQI